MAKEFGPFTSAVKVVTYDPDDADQVRNVSGAAWVTLSSATFANCISTAAQEGATGIYFADLPSGLDATRRYVVAVYGASESAFSGSHQVYAWEPENAPINLKQISGDTAAADNLERWFDGTVGFGTSGSVITGSLSGAVGSVTIVTNIVTGGAINTTGGAVDLVTTVTNSTNAPTNGDFTAVMKTSVQTAAAAALTAYDPPTNAELTAALAGADDATLAAIAAMNNLSAAQVNAEVDTALSDYGALRPTVAGRTLDVTATGAAGIDWANVENPTTTLNLSGTTVTTVVSVTNVGADVWSYSSRTLTGPARQISSRQVGTLSIVKGDSRLNADGNAITITRATNSTDWPTDITSWTPKLSIRPSDDLLAANSAAASLTDISGTVVTATGDSRAVRFDLTAAQTATLAVTSKALYDYDVQLSSGSSRATVETGACYVGDEQTTG